jgi:hypothetical protein
MKSRIWLPLLFNRHRQNLPGGCFCRDSTPPVLLVWAACQLAALAVWFDAFWAINSGADFKKGHRDAHR